MRKTETDVGKSFLMDKPKRYSCLGRWFLGSYNPTLEYPQVRRGCFVKRGLYLLTGFRRCKEIFGGTWARGY